MKILVECEECGKSFNRKPSHILSHVFCSFECYGTGCSKHRKGENNPSWNGGKITKVCEECGKRFKVYPSLKAARFCSIKCKNKRQEGKAMGIHLSDDASERLREMAKRRWQNPAFREKMSEALTGRTFSNEAKIKMASLWKDKEHIRNVLDGMHKKWEAPDYRSKMLSLLKLRNNDPKFIEKRIKGLIKRPTTPEKALINFIEDYSLPFKYVGNGEVIIGNLNPDFIHTGGEKKVIEVFGRAFHDPDETFRDEIPWRQQYWGRMTYFSQLGYDCLILWDDELKDEGALVKRIKSFMG